MRETGDDPVVTLSDGVAMLRPWSKSDAGFLRTHAPTQRSGGTTRFRLRRGRSDAAALIDEFELAWRTFASSGTPSGVAFAIADAASADLVGRCGIDEWSKADVAQFGYWIAATARGRGFATRR